MENIIKIINEWPVIIQGALGSALFAFLLYFGQKLFAYYSQVTSSYSSKTTQRKIRREIFRLQALKATNNNDKSYYASMLWFQASSRVIKGLIWLTMGLVFSSVIDVIGFVGYIGCLYYLFEALDIIKPIERVDNIDETINNLQNKLKEIEKA